MPAYDSDLFDPPAPVAAVAVRNPATGDVRSAIPMLIDSGADVTLLPLAAAETLGLSRDEGPGYELVGFDGSRSIAPSVRADLLFLGKTSSGRFLLAPGECGVLGRNVMNHVALVLDGPLLKWRDTESPSGA